MQGFQHDAREFVRQHACIKGQPNLTSRGFAEWVKANWGHDIGDDTARRWLHKLGFNQKRYSKGVYFDGHKRDDVVADRQKFFDYMSMASQQAYKSLNVLREGENQYCRYTMMKPPSIPTRFKLFTGPMTPTSLCV